MPRRDPFEVWLLAALVLASLAWLLAPNRTDNTVTSALPVWERYMWSAGLFTGASAALAGLLLRSTLGLVIERVGLSVLGGWCLGYGAAVVGVAGFRGTISAALVLALAIAAGARIRQIGRELRAAATGEALLRRDLRKLE